MTVLPHPNVNGKELLTKDAEIGLNNLSSASNDDQYWAVALDGRIIKSMYKDELLIPSRALAVVVAAEWERQHDVVDMR